MRGHERIIRARNGGSKPSTWVFVDVRKNVENEVIAKCMDIDPEMCLSPGVPLHPHVIVPFRESTRFADWSWAIGLKIQIDGDDEARVMAAHEEVVKSGALIVVSSICIGGNVIVIDSRGQ